MAKADYMRALRDKRLAQFEEKRQKARTIVQNREIANFEKVSGSLRGQLGQPFKLFSDLNTALQKLEARAESKSAWEETKEDDRKAQLDSSMHSECKTEEELDE